MFEFDGKEYELKYNLKRVEMIEDVTGAPTLRVISRNGMLLSQLKAYIGMGIVDTDNEEEMVSRKKGFDLAEKIIQTKGVVWANVEVINALRRDCGFFFQND